MLCTLPSTPLTRQEHRPVPPNWNFQHGSKFAVIVNMWLMLYVWERLNSNLPGLQFFSGDCNLSKTTLGTVFNVYVHIYTLSYKRAAIISSITLPAVDSFPFFIYTISSELNGEEILKITSNPYTTLLLFMRENIATVQNWVKRTAMHTKHKRTYSFSDDSMLWFTEEKILQWPYRKIAKCMNDSCNNLEKWCREGTPARKIGV